MRKRSLLAFLAGAPVAAVAAKAQAAPPEPPVPATAALAPDVLPIGTILPFDFRHPIPAGWAVHDALGVPMWQHSHPVAQMSPHTHSISAVPCHTHSVTVIYDPPPAIVLLGHIVRIA